MAEFTGSAYLKRADEAVAEARQLLPRAAVAREMRAIWRAEINGSTALASSELSPAQVDALLDRDRAEGNHRFGDYAMVRAYADAARWVADNRSYGIGDPRPLLAVDELRTLNARLSVGPGARGGAWRQDNPVTNGGIVSPAAWLVAREVSTLLDRFGRGPQDDPIALWLAKFNGRFARILPFDSANGRTGRLAANLMLRRLDVVPVVFEPRDRPRFALALAAAETSEPRELATLIARALVRTCNRLIAAGSGETTAVEPLRALADGDYIALAKAAQRGRLRTVVRGGRYFSTREWIATYRAITGLGRPARRRTRPTP